MFKDEEIAYALSRQLRWTHCRTLIYIEDSLKRTAFSRKPYELLTAKNND